MATVTASGWRGRTIPEGRPGLAEVRRAVSDLRTLREEMARHRGLKPLTEEEIRDAVNERREMGATSLGTSDRL